MTNAEFVDALSDRPLCLRCLSLLTAPMPSSVLLALFAVDVESKVGACEACKSETDMTYCFHRRARSAA